MKYRNGPVSGSVTADQVARQNLRHWPLRPRAVVAYLRHCRAAIFGHGRSSEGKKSLGICKSLHDMTQRGQIGSAPISLRHRRCNCPGRSMLSLFDALTGMARWTHDRLGRFLPPAQRRPGRRMSFAFCAIEQISPDVIAYLDTLDATAKATDLPRR